MAIFSSGDKMEVSYSEATVVAKGTVIRGEVDVKCKLHIDGKVEGSVISNSTVTIGTTGEVKGSVFAESLVVSGELLGNADCKNVEILANGKVIGDILSSNLVLESKSHFEGTSKIRIEDSANNKNFKNSILSTKVGVKVAEKKA